MEQPFLELNNGQIDLRLASDGSRLEIISARGGRWERDNFIIADYGGLRLELLRWSKVHTSLSDGEIKIRISDTVWYARFPGHGYLKPDPPPPISFSFRIRLDGDEVLFITEVPEGLDDETLEISFPHTALKWDASQSGELAGAFNSLGSLYSYPSTEQLKLDYAAILPVAGFFTQDGGLGIRTKDIFDYRLRLEVNLRGTEGAGTIIHGFERGKSEYERMVRMRFFPAGSNYVDLAKWHRESVKREHRFVSLKEKIAAAPEVGKLAGSVIWKHNTFAKAVPPGVKKDYSLYIWSVAEGEAEGRPGNWSAREVFDTAHAAGFDRVCILNTGWNNKGYDSGYPTRFPVNPERGTEADFHAAAEYGRSLSPDYIFSVHDNYRDVYPNSPEFSFDEIVRSKEGGLLKGGIWRGGRCYLLCSGCTLKYAQRDLPHIAAMCGRGAIYLDVQGCVGLCNCYHPDHPGSRRDDARWRLETFRIAKKHIGAVATEGAPHEFAVPEIDLGAYPRIKSAGNASNLRPIPFFQLVYHDSLYTFCGQGLSGFYGREYANYAALYCMLPWDFGADSLRISRELRGSCSEEMLLHEFVSEHVQHTVFADGVQVFANSGDRDEEDVPAGSFVIRK